MSNTYLDVADDALRLLRGFQAIEQVAAAFASVGTLEQTRAEVAATLDALRPQVAQARDELAQASGALADVQAAATAERASTAERLALAEAKILEDEAASQARAQALKDEADAWVLEQRQRLDQRIAAAAAERQVIVDDIVTLQAKLDTLQAQAKQLLG